MKCMVVDDDLFVGRYIQQQMLERYGPMVEVLVFDNPFEAIRQLQPDVDILIVDYEMPGLSGPAFIDFAVQRGIDRHRIIVLSSHDPDEIRQTIPLGRCLAIIHKQDRTQHEILRLIMDSLIKRARSKRPFPEGSASNA